MAELILREEVYAIAGAAMEVYNKMGRGFLEPVYQNALEIELGLRSIPFLSQPPIKIQYKGVTLKRVYVPDLLCFGKIIVDLKSLDRLTPLESAQLINYLRATGLQVGMLINFGNSEKLEWKRLVV